MNMFRPHHVLLVLLLLIMMGATFMIEAGWTRPNYEVFPDMAVSIPVEAQSLRWREFADDRSADAPRHSVSYLLDVDIAEANPFTAKDTTARLRGTDIYGVFCAPCHGGSGNGDGPVVRRGFPPPPSLTALNAVQMPDTAMYRIISRGQRTMPSYHSQLTPLDRWRAVLHVRQIQKQALSPDEPPSGRDQDAAGERDAAAQGDSTISTEGAAR